MASCAAQAYEPLEILVYDGGSTDGTVEAVQSQFPQVRLTQANPDPGFPVLRNLGVREARGEYVVSLDDDAYYTDRFTIRQLVGDFRARPEAAAIAMPFIEPFGPWSLDGKTTPKVEPLSRLRTLVG